MHDDRITGVTFEENASHNALIVNEEYAWVGNPFSAPQQKGESLRFSLLLCFCGSCGLAVHDLVPPLSEVEGVNGSSRNPRAKRKCKSRFSLHRGWKRDLKEGKGLV